MNSEEPAAGHRTLIESGGRLRGVRRNGTAEGGIDGEGEGIRAGAAKTIGGRVDASDGRAGHAAFGEKADAFVFEGGATAGETKRTRW